MSYDLVIRGRALVVLDDHPPALTDAEVAVLDGRIAGVALPGAHLAATHRIELSPDEKTLYVNESVQKKIWAFDVDKQGNISNKRLFAEFPDFGFDGMKCDKKGNLYATRYGKGVVVVLSPQGKIIREVTLKGKNCSNLVFGGAGGKQVYVTLQDRKGMETFTNDIPGKAY